MKILKSLAVAVLAFPIVVMACSFDTDCNPGSRCAKASGSIYHNQCTINGVTQSMGSDSIDLWFLASYNVYFSDERVGNGTFTQICDPRSATTCDSSG